MPDFNEHLRLSSWNYRIMELKGEDLRQELQNCTRETIINWLQWNDRNGIYTDELSLIDIPTKVRQCSATKYPIYSGAKYASQTGF